MEIGIYGIQFNQKKIKIFQELFNFLNEFKQVNTVSIHAPFLKLLKQNIAGIENFEQFNSFEELKKFDFMLCLGGDGDDHHFILQPCNHRFHTTCIVETLRINGPRCPLCRGLPGDQHAVENIPIVENLHPVDNNLIDNKVEINSLYDVLINKTKLEKV